MTPVIPQATPAWRGEAAKQLAELAGWVLAGDNINPGVVLAVVYACSPHIEDDAERMRLWEEFLHRAELEKGIDEGTIPWQAVDDSLTCTARTETAREIARQDTAEALAALVGAAS